MSDSSPEAGSEAVETVAAVADAWRKAGIAGAAIGVVAAGAAAGLVVERFTAGRGLRRKAQLALDVAGPYGALRGTPGKAYADDGTELYYEVDEAEPDGGPALRRRRLFGPRRPAPRVTVVFCHGYCLTQDAWHFQRAALRGVVRTVSWDQRSHGRSGRGVAQREGVPVTIEQLGRDLRAVLDAAVPEGPVVLVGHSMGGMTIMALADAFPEFVAERVAGVALIGTSAGRLAEVSFGLPAAGVKAVRRILPGVLNTLGRRAELVERGRRATAELFTGVVKHYSFARKDIDPAVARFAERMISATPVDVVAEFYPAFTDHDKAAALERFAALPVLVLAGDQDLITPVEHSETIAGLLPAAELVLVPEAGHLVMLEHPELVNDRLADLLVRTGTAAAATATVGDYERTGPRRAGRPGG